METAVFLDFQTFYHVIRFEHGLNLKFTIIELYHLMYTVIPIDWKIL